ncbi:MAG: hypothetical protein K9W42_08895 [Candidatus Heimdallarchaeota archaeon]|nr:hypothetical protein [Candidatus Heimdallarchaeota archaeon]
MEQSREEFNKELIKTLQKLVSPKRLNHIYDRVISLQTNKKTLEHQQYVLGIIQDYIKEIDGYLTER